jgi:L-amino acid N-acyltransferase YncA
MEAAGDHEEGRATTRALREEPFAFSDDFDDERDRPLDHFRAAMGDSGEHFTVGAFDERSTLIGIATWRRDPRRKARHKSHVHTMYVAREARRRGVGARLLDFVIDHARRLGVEQIHLWVLDPTRSAARSLYQSVGFAPQGALVRDDLFVDGRYVDAEYMTLALARAVTDHGGSPGEGTR